MFIYIHIYVMLYYVILYYIMLYYMLLYYMMWYYIILYFIHIAMYTGRKMDLSIDKDRDWHHERRPGSWHGSCEAGITSPCWWRFGEGIVAVGFSRCELMISGCLSHCNAEDANCNGILFVPFWGPRLPRLPCF